MGALERTIPDLVMYGDGADLMPGEVDETGGRFEIFRVVDMPSEVLTEAAAAA